MTQNEGAAALRERAEQRHREGYGFKAIARELGVDRDMARRLVGAECPTCAGRMSIGARRCRRCSRDAARKPEAERLTAPVAAHLTPVDAERFRSLCRSRGTTVAAALREYVREQLAGTEGER
jgi:hypothetical protein